MGQVVLVVDGNVHAGKLYKAVIEHSGHHAILTEDPGKVLKLARAGQPDQVVLDAHLADNASASLIERMRGTSEKTVRVIPTSCLEIEPGSSMGPHADAKITKPFNRQQIAAAVDQVLNKTTISSARNDSATSVENKGPRQVSTSSEA
jgi:DNA-binding response OmpR family regulator